MHKIGPSSASRAARPKPTLTEGQTVPTRQTEKKLELCRKYFFAEFLISTLVLEATVMMELNVKVSWFTHI